MGIKFEREGIQHTLELADRTFFMNELSAAPGVPLQADVIGLETNGGIVVLNEVHDNPAALPGIPIEEQFITVPGARIALGVGEHRRVGKTTFFGTAPAGVPVE